MRKNILILLLILLVGVGFAFPALAGTFDQIKEGLGISGAAFGSNGDRQRDFVDAWSTYVNGLAGILSALFLILVIYGGWLWMTARGSEEQVTRAKKIVLGAIIGIAVIIFARLIAQLAILYLGTSSGLGGS